MTREDMIKDLIEKMSEGSNLFIGKYDAKNGNEHFMHGIGTVMEYLAYEVSKEYGEDFSDMFTKNMIDSEHKI